jgi:hypothetical protein
MIIFLNHSARAIFRRFKIACCSALKEAEIPIKSANQSNQLPLLLCKIQSKLDLPRLLKKLPSTLTFTVLSKGKIQVTAHIDICII